MASITVQTPYNEYTGNGSATVYAYTFLLLSASDLVVKINGATTTAYSLSGVGTSSGGNVTFTTAPASGATVLISREIPLSRSIEYQTNGDFRASTVNLDFNRLWQYLQLTVAKLGGHFRAPYPEQVNEGPSNTARLDRLLAFHPTTGQPKASDLTETQLASAVAAAYTGAAGPLDALSFIQAGAGAVTRTAQNKDRDLVSVKDFGAVSDGVTDDTTAWGNWIAASGSKYITSGSYLVSGVPYVYRTPTFVNTADTNHAAGLYALDSISSGNANTAVGNLAGSAVTTGSQNTAIGKSAMEAMQSGNNNTAIGFGALRYANDATCIQNTIVGAFCGEGITTGNSNTAVGHNTLKTLTIGDLNTAVGQGALAYNVTGNLNSAVGYHALLYYEGDSATAMGIEALMNCTTGAGNVAFGRGALKQVTTQALNTAVGHLAGTSCSGSNNVFLGESAGWLTTTGSDNTVVGMNALVTNTTGEHNVAVGRGALLSNNNSRNVAVGRYAAISATSDENTAIGNGALYDCTSGRANTALGVGSLAGLATFDNCVGLGAGTAVTGSNQVQLGDSSTTTYAYGAVQNRSDARDKADVRDTVFGLEFINALRPVDFKWDYREDYAWGEKDGSKKRARYHHGLIAQEVKATADALGVDFGGFQDHSVNGGKDVLSLGYEELVPVLIKAVQELKADFDAYKAAHP